jgi:hypothetical protein
LQGDLDGIDWQRFGQKHLHRLREVMGTRYSGHSGRVGLVVAAKEAGAADSDIASTTRHKSLQMIKRYGEAAEQRRRAPHRLPGVGL